MDIFDRRGNQIEKEIMDDGIVNAGDGDLMYDAR